MFLGRKNFLLIGLAFFMFLVTFAAFLGSVFEGESIFLTFLKGGFLVLTFLVIFYYLFVNYAVFEADGIFLKIGLHKTKVKYENFDNFEETLSLGVNYSMMFKNIVFKKDEKIVFGFSPKNKSLFIETLFQKKQDLKENKSW